MDDLFSTIEIVEPSTKKCIIKKWKKFLFSVDAFIETFDTCMKYLKFVIKIRYNIKMSLLITLLVLVAVFYYFDYLLVVHGREMSFHII